MFRKLMFLLNFRSRSSKLTRTGYTFSARIFPWMRVKWWWCMAEWILQSNHIHPLIYEVLFLKVNQIDHINETVVKYIEYTKGSSPKYFFKSLSDWLKKTRKAFWLVNRKIVHGKPIAARKLWRSFPSSQSKSSRSYNQPIRKRFEQYFGDDPLSRRCFPRHFLPISLCLYILMHSYLKQGRIEVKNIHYNLSLRTRFRRILT